MGENDDHKMIATIAVAVLIFIAGLAIGAFMHATGGQSPWERDRGMQYEAVRLGYGKWIDRGGFWSGGYEFSWNIPAPVKAEKVQP